MDLDGFRYFLSESFGPRTKVWVTKYEVHIDEDEWDQIRIEFPHLYFRFGRRDNLIEIGLKK